MQKQLEYLKEYKTRLELAVGKERTKNLMDKAAFVISCGTNDFVITYYGTPFRRQTYTISSYQQFLLQHVQQFLQVCSHIIIKGRQVQSHLCFQ